MTLNSKMELGGATETVTITDQPPLINTSNAELGPVINQTGPNPFRGVFPSTSDLGQGATITRERLAAHSRR